MALHAGERLGPYEILGAVGAGGRGEVYRARDPRLGRTVCGIGANRPLEAVSLSGRRRVLARGPGAMSLYDVSRDGLVLLQHAVSRGRVFAHAPGDIGERELSIFDAT